MYLNCRYYRCNIKGAKCIKLYYMFLYLEKILIQFGIFKRYYRCDIKGAESGLLAGKTVAIKDNVCVAGVPMMNGSKLLEGFVPDRDATIVTRILDAGTVKHSLTE